MNTWLKHTNYNLQDNAIKKLFWRPEVAQLRYRLQCPAEDAQKALEELVHVEVAQADLLCQREAKHPALSQAPPPSKIE